MEKCPHCGFEEMIVSSYSSLYFEAICPICGYARWAEESVPDNCDVELAKFKLAKMNNAEKQRAVELFHQDGMSLIARLRGGRDS